MTEPIIHSIFPTTVTFHNLGRDFTQEEKDFFTEMGKTRVHNMGNVASADNYLMKHEVMKDINASILKAVNHYIDTIIQPITKVEPYVTQAWLNFTEPGQYHHKHEHPNSFISGVLYINAEENVDKITLYDSIGYQQLKLYPKEHTWHNSSSWWFNVKTADIIVFPSSLTHMVEQTKSGDTRVSLAFNTFLKGHLGNNFELTELNL